MRRPSYKLNRSQKSIPTSLAAPIGGWNARDSLADMDPLDAVDLINFFPHASDVLLRDGHTRFATGLPSQVETVMAYVSPTTQKLFGISSGSIYDITAGGAVGVAAVTGLTNSRWQTINMSTAAGSYLVAVNGADKRRVYNGTWHADGDGAPYDVTGVNTANCIQINLFKNRIWMVEKDTLKIWYLPTNSLGGAASPLDFMSIAQEGGFLMAMGTWTQDAGFGLDDLAVFITSEGEIIVYRGTDPSSASTWALVGVYQIGSPIGRRCFIKYEGDLLLITQDGVVPLSGALQSSRVNPRIALTDKIQPAVSNATTLYGENFGWQLLQFPKSNILFLNVPINEGSSQEQYAMNTVTKAWCRFQAWDSNCWEIFNDDPYFGGNGFVGKAWDGLSDNGTNINGTAKQAFNYFGTPGEIKQWTMMRPTLLTSGAPSLFVSINVDFEDSGSASALSFAPTAFAAWDTAVWDSSVWGAGLNVQKSWQGVNGIGYCAATRLEIASQGIEVRWVSTDLIMKKGGIL